MRSLEVQEQIVFEPVEGVMYLPSRGGEGFHVGAFTAGVEVRGSDEPHSQVQIIPVDQYLGFYETTTGKNLANPDDYGFRLTAPGDELNSWLADTKERADDTVGVSLANEEFVLQKVGSRACRLLLSENSRLHYASDNHPAGLEVAPLAPLIRPRAF